MMQTTILQERYPGVRCGPALCGSSTLPCTLQKVGQSCVTSTYISCVPNVFCASKETDTLLVPWSLCQQLWDTVGQFVFLSWAGGLTCASLCSAQGGGCAGCACPQGPAATGMLRGATRSGRRDRQGQCPQHGIFSEVARVLCGWLWACGYHLSRGAWGLHTPGLAPSQ